MRSEAKKKRRGISVGGRGRWGHIFASSVCPPPHPALIFSLALLFFLLLLRYLRQGSASTVFAKSHRLARDR
jgi:hypothetical protein